MSDHPPAPERGRAVLYIRLPIDALKAAAILKAAHRAYPRSLVEAVGEWWILTVEESAPTHDQTNDRP